MICDCKAAKEWDRKGDMGIIHCLGCDMWFFIPQSRSDEE